MSKQSSTAASSSTNSLILFEVIWAVVALLFFLFFSVPPDGGDRPQWYLNGITVLETGAFVISSLLCFRNWQSGQIVSGRGVWRWIFLGLLSYAVGNVFFYIWNSVFGLDPDVSLGDAFYLLSYVFLAAGMLQAVLPRRLNLEVRQWGIVALTGFLGVALVVFLNVKEPPEVVGQLSSTGNESAMATPQALLVRAPAVPLPTSVKLPTVNLEVAPAANVLAVTAPPWAATLDAALEPYADIVGWLYVLGDCLLLVVAATLLVAFWGGRFTQSWKLIAVAAFCLYIADVFFAYYINVLDAYQEGDLWEIFWTFSAIFFGLGAIVEHSVSSRSRRTSRRRRA
ncbi:MAG: hypothetical protein ACFBSF_03430 [Leptolyngbyaceae cyanobacterium]